MSIMNELAEFQVEVTPSILNAVKMTFLDTLSAMILGIKEEELQQLIQTISQFDTSNGFQIVGSQNKFSLTDAAFILGTSSVAVELDEGNQWSKGHPAVHVLPMLLLHAQMSKQYTGSQFIKHLIESYEVCTYFGKITKLKPALHAHGTWGVIGSALALAIANDYDLSKRDALIDIAATFATPTKWTAATEGAGIRNVYLGESLVGGLRTWQLANANIKAPANNAQFIFSEVLGSEFDLTQSFNQQFLAIEKNYFKFHAFCRYVHVPLEAFQTLVAQHQIQATDIRAVNVYTYERASTLSAKKTENSLSSKFSIPFALSSWLYEQRSNHDIFEDKLYLREDIRALAQKITVQHDLVLDENYPNDMPAVVEIILENDQVYKLKQDYALGGPEEKSSWLMICEKFIQNTKHHLSEKGQQQLIEFIEQLPSQQNISEVLTIINDNLEGGNKL